MSASNWDICPKCKGDLREDYEIGVESNGNFYCYYKSQCDSCEYNFKFEKDIKTLEGDK